MTNKPAKIIGGMFGLPEKGSTGSPLMLPTAPQGPPLFLANASSGLYVLVESLAPRQVWMPSYLCGVMIEAVKPHQVPLRFYEVKDDLIPALDWLDEVQAGDLVVLIDYFGFPTEPTCAYEAKKRGAWLCRDASQALLSKSIADLYDFELFSPRKVLGVPDGGILLGHHPAAPDLQKPPTSWWRAALVSTILRRDFDRVGGNRRWFDIFRQSEASSPIGPYAMSQLSQRLLSDAFDYSAIARRRRRNYEVLASHLAHVALKPTLDEGVVPLGFPIVLPERDRVREALFKHQIYPPVHWPIAGIVPAKFEDSHRLSADMMTIPCDQRYESEDMEWVAKKILNELSP